MKHYSDTLLPEVGRRGIKALTTITSEVLDAAKKSERRFTPADLWNIQKQRRTYSIGRFL